MLRYSIQTMLRCIKRWNQSPRMIMMFMMLACIILIYALPFVENARVQSEKLQVGELFVALTNWRFSMLIFSCSIILLFCDLPIVDRFATNAIIRGSRRSWFLGQALYVIVTSVLCATGVLLLSVVVALPNLSFSNAWSRPVKLMASSGRIAIDPARMKLTMDSYVVKMFSPNVALLHSYLLLMLLNCFYGMASLVARMYVQAGSFIQVSDSQSGRFFCNDVYSLCTGLVSEAAYLSTLFGPSSISIHYNGYMGGDTAFVYLLSIWHVAICFI